MSQSQKQTPHVQSVEVVYKIKIEIKMESKFK